MSQAWNCLVHQSKGRIPFFIKNNGPSELQRTTLNEPKPIKAFSSNRGRLSCDFSFLPLTKYFSGVFLLLKKYLTWQKIPCSLDQTREWNVRARLACRAFVLGKRNRRSTPWSPLRENPKPIITTHTTPEVTQVYHSSTLKDLAVA